MIDIEDLDLIKAKEDGKYGLLKAGARDAAVVDGFTAVSHSILPSVVIADDEVNRNSHSAIRQSNSSTSSPDTYKRTPSRTKDSPTRSYSSPPSSVPSSRALSEILLRPTPRFPSISLRTRRVVDWIWSIRTTRSRRSLCRNGPLRSRRRGKRCGKSWRVISMFDSSRAGMYIGHNTTRVR